MILVYVKGYLNYRKTIPEQVVTLPEGSATLRKLLTQLASEFQELSLDLAENDQVDKRRAGMAVLVNGCHYIHLPGGLDTRLKNGDRVSIFPPLAGG